MYFVEKIISNSLLDESQLPKNFNHVNSVFFDIETSGLSPKTSPVFLIGILFFKGTDIILRQYFADNPSEEADILTNFVEDIKHFETIYHFNGLSFDIPFVNERLAFNGINYNIDKTTSFDIFQQVRKNKLKLCLNGCRLKDVEEYMGIFREDDLSGKEVADAYKLFVKNHNNSIRDNILLHNEEDIINLYRIIPVLNRIDAPPKRAESELNITNLEISIIEGQVIFSGKFSEVVKNSLFVEDDNCFVSLDNTDQCFIIKLPISEGVLYYHFKDYKNYYYIPELDQAVHKTAAKYYRFTEKQAAAKENCYTKHITKYIELPVSIDDEKLHLCSISQQCFPNCVTIDELLKIKDISQLSIIISKTIEYFLSRPQ